MHRRLRRGVAWCVSSVILMFALFGCQQEYNFEREPTPVRTLGHELFVIWKKDANRSAENADTKVQMLDENYVQFVAAVDTVAPDDQLTQIDLFLQNLLKLVDEGILPALTRKMTELVDEAVNNTELLNALATPSGPDTESFVQPGFESNLAGYVTGYPKLPQFLEMVSRIGTENDGFDADGKRTFDEPDSVTDASRVLARELRDFENGDDPLAVTLRDLALVEDARYTADEVIGELWVVLYDERGFPLAAKDGDVLSFPFVDSNADGLADLDGSGNFVLQNGGAALIEPFSRTESIDAPVLRDEIGRATVPGGGLAFQYVNLHDTGLGFLVREFRELSTQDTAFDMLVAFETIMGPKTAHTDESGGYQGYTANHPLADLMYALIHILDVPELPSILRGMALLVDRRPDKLAQLFYAFDDVIDVLNKYPDSGMTDQETMIYDLLPYLQEIVQNPALWADIMQGFRRPISAKTGEALSTLLRYKDVDAVPTPGGPYDACFLNCAETLELGTLARYSCVRACPNGELFAEPMDFDAPESELGRSLLQKYMHLIRDTAGVEYAMNVEEASINGSPLPQLPPLIRLPGAGEAFLRSIAGQLDLGEYVPDEVWTSDLGDLLNLLGVDSGDVASMLSILSPLFGAELDVRPSPHQITRLFNQQNLRFETDSVVLDIADPVCKDNFVMSQHLAYGLFVGEAAGTIDTLQPLAVAFANHNSERILAGILSVLHDHYAENKGLYKTRLGGQSEMKAANMRSYERALLEILSNDDLFVSLNEFAVAVKEVEDETGVPIEDDLRKLLASALESGFTNRRGEDYILVEDGRTINQPSKMHFLVHAVGESTVRLRDVPETRKRLRTAVGNLADVAIGAEKDTNGVPKFKRPGSPAIAAHSLGYLADKAAEKVDTGELSIWLTIDLLNDIEEFWTSRLLTALVDLASNTLENEADKALIDDFVNYLFGSIEGRSNLLVATHALLVSSMSSGSWEPIAKFFGRALDPDRQWQSEPYANVPLLTLGAEMLAKTLQYDPENTGIFLIHRGLERPQGGQAPFDVLIDIIAAYFSPDPLADQLQTPQDYQHFLNELGKYMEDDVHGVERLYELVGRRNK